MTIKNKNGTKEHDTAYAIVPARGDMLIFRIKDSRKLSEIAKDFEDPLMITHEGDDFSLFSELTKVSRDPSSPEYVNMVLRKVS